MKVIRLYNEFEIRGVARKIASISKENGMVILQLIGEKAINKAMKAIAIARGYVVPMGKDLICIPAFSEVYTYGKKIDGMKIVVQIS